MDGRIYALCEQEKQANREGTCLSLGIGTINGGTYATTTAGVCTISGVAYFSASMGVGAEGIRRVKDLLALPLMQLPKQIPG